MRAILGIVATIGRKSKHSTGQSFEFESSRFSEPPNSAYFSQNLNAGIESPPVTDFSYEVASVFDFADSTDSEENVSYNLDSYYQKRPESVAMPEGFVKFRMGGSVRSSGGSTKTILVDDFIPPLRFK